VRQRDNVCLASKCFLLKTLRVFASAARRITATGVAWRAAAWWSGEGSHQRNATLLLRLRRIKTMPRKRRTRHVAYSTGSVYKSVIMARDRRHLGGQKGKSINIAARTRVSCTVSWRERGYMTGKSRGVRSVNAVWRTAWLPLSRRHKAARAVHFTRLHTRGGIWAAFLQHNKLGSPLCYVMAISQTIMTS